MVFAEARQELIESIEERILGTARVSAQEIHPSQMAESDTRVNRETW